MKWKWILGLGVAAAMCSAGALAAINAKGPSVAQIDADVAEIDQEISAAQATANRYGEGSVLRVQTEMQIAVLRTTRAMLDQKRRSWLRGLSLSYTVAGRPLGEAPPEKVAEAEREIAKALGDLRVAEIKVQSSGGLLQTVALVEEQTHRVTLAIAKQRVAMLRLGLGLPASEPGTADVAKRPPIGRTVNDKGAL